MRDEMKIVKFENGMYAVRKGSWLFGYSFADLKVKGFFWPMNDFLFNDCQGTKEQCEDFIKSRTISK